MKVLLVGLLALGSFSTFASDLKLSKIKVGQKANFSILGSGKDVGYVLEILPNEKVKLSSSNGVFIRKVSNIGIEVESGCLDGICVGDRVEVTPLINLEPEYNEHPIVRIVFDNGFAYVPRSAESQVVKLSKLTKL